MRYMTTNRQLRSIVNDFIRFMLAEPLTTPFVRVDAGIVYIQTGPSTAGRYRQDLLGTALEAAGWRIDRRRTDSEWSMPVSELLSGADA